MDVELEPEQPEEVRAAVANLLSEPVREPDPWWQAGLEDELGT